MTTKQLPLKRLIWMCSSQWNLLALPVGAVSVIFATPYMSPRPAKVRTARRC